jgi:tRNA 2-selenouridine synthase
MAYKQIEVEEFLRLAVNFPVLDVRSPSEYEQAHIPKAKSIPLFSDEERAIVGTLYKQISRGAAIRRGLDFFGPKLNHYLTEAEQIIARHGMARSENTTFLVHCWRGGMRSAGIAWLLDLYGYDVYTLRGGYKAFRNWVLGQFTKEWKIRCLGGYTGSGKTEILAALQKAGEYFGGIGQPGKQPSQEMFENELAIRLQECTALTTEELTDSIWIEDESQRIGSVNIPQPLWERMKSSELVFMDIPFEKRLEYIAREYGRLDRSSLVAAVSRLQKKLGGLETKDAIGYILDGDLANGFRILLKYYDKLYLKALDKKRERIHSLERLMFDEVEPMAISEKILAKYGR